MDIQLNEIKTTSALPLNDRFFDCYNGSKLVAHICRPLVLEKDRRYTITLYNHDRSIVEQRKTISPIAAARMHMKRLMCTDLSN